MQKYDSVKFLGDYFDGAWVKSENANENWEIRSPADQNDLITHAEGHFNSVAVACGTAKKAFKKWSRTSLNERKDHLIQLKKVFQKRADEMARLISRETGKPLWESKTEASALSAKIDVTLEHSLKLIADENIPAALPGIDGVIRYRPRGVMAVVGPFNFPAHLPNGHIIPSLVAGNTVVLKPSDKTPSVGQFYAECFHEAGFPSGVFNLVQGRSEVGRRLVQNENVDGVLFTGSYEVGLKIKHDTLDHYWKLLALEMGGKNSSLIWSDADLEKAVYETIIGAYMTTGQRCSCTSKVILHKNIRDRFIENFHETAKKLTIGHWEDNPFMGPLISQEASDKYLRFQDIAKREGAECLMRGKILETTHPGYYVTPSIHLVSKFDKDSTYQKNEIFGPNVAVYTVDDFDEALEIINAGGFGLVTSIFTKDRTLYEKTVLEAKVGLVNWNRTTNGASSRMPFGGIGKSGNDRASGHFAIQYCAVPVASLEDLGSLDKNKLLPGVNFNFL